jgi:predicted dehydrogenase
VIRVGILGCNYGRTVLLPAFRTDSRCEVVALAGTDAVWTAVLAHAANVARGSGNWIALVEDGAVDAIAIAVPPIRQPEIARDALARGKALFVEKPLAPAAARLVRRFLDACAGGGAASPGLAEGYRAQVLLDAAWRAHTTRCFVDVPPPAAEKESR